MIEYSALLNAAFTALTGKGNPEVLAILPDQIVTSDLKGESSSQRPLFPASLVPGNSVIKTLQTGETFIDCAVLVARESTADCVFVALLPIGQLRLSPAYRDRFGRLGIEEATVQSLLADLSIHASTFAFLVTNQFLSSQRSGSWRSKFFPNCSAIVIEHELDQQLGPVPHRFSTVLLSKERGPIRFFKIPESIGSDNCARVFSDLSRLIRQPAGRSQYGYVHQGHLEERYPACYDFYSEETEKLRQEVSELGAKVQLQEVADVLLGYRPCRPEREVDRGQNGVLAISARDITVDGKVDLSEVRTVDRAQVQHYLQEGDICIRQIYKHDAGFVLAVYAGDGRQITFSSNVIVVRPHSQLLPAQRDVLVAFLRSPMAQRLGSTKQQVSTIGDFLRLTPHVLREFPVPIADKEILTAMDNLAAAREAFQEWLSEIDEAANAIVKESSAAGSRRVILESGQLARQRFRAAKQVEELGYRISTQFPHPLAYVWRDVQVSGPDRYHRFRAVTKAAEVHTCYLAQLAIVLARVTDKRIAYLDSLSRRLSERRGGTNFGDWFAIVKEVKESRVFRVLDKSAPLAELQTLSSHWEPSIGKLMQMRNDDSHGRLSPHNVTKEFLEDAEAALTAVYQATDFLTDYRLILVTDTQFDSLRRLTQLTYRDLSGDNPLAPRYSAESERSDLESGSLYLRDRQGELQLLRPLLNYLECPECHQMSTFFLDTYDNSKPSQVGLKSIERSSVRTEEFADSFRHVGILK